MTQTTGVAEALPCTCGHREGEHTWCGGMFCRTGSCWHSTRLPHEGEAIVRYHVCECAKYEPDRESRNNMIEKALVSTLDRSGTSIS